MKKILLAALMAVTIPCASQVNVQGSNIQVGGLTTGNPCATPTTVQISNGSSFTCDPNIKITPSTHSLNPAAVTDIQQAGVGSENIDLNHTYLNSLTKSGNGIASFSIPPTYPLTDGLTNIPNSAQAFAILSIDSSGHINTPIVANPGAYNSCPTTTTLNIVPVSGTAAIVTPHCALDPSTGRNIVTSMSVVNTTGVYHFTSPNMFAVAPVPDQVPYLSIFDYRQGGQAQSPIVGVDSKCVVGNSYNSSCIMAAIAEAVRKNPSNPAISFSGRSMGLNKLGVFVFPGLDSTIPNGDCGGVPCAAQPPLAPKSIDVALDIQGIPLTVYGNRVTLQTDWNPGVSFKNNQLAIWANRSNTRFYNINYQLTRLVEVGNGDFQNLTQYSSYNYVGQVSQYQNGDRSLFLNNLCGYCMTGRVTGGQFMYRSPNLSTGETVDITYEGYIDSNIIDQFEFRNAYSYTYYPSQGEPTETHYTDDCGVTPGGNAGPGELLNEQFDLWATHSCLWGVNASNTTSIPGLTFYVKQRGLLGNSLNFTVDATTHSEWPFLSLGGTAIALYALDENGNNRTLRGMYDAINGADGTGAVLAGMGVVASLTGTPSANIVASGATTFSGGVDSLYIPASENNYSYQGIYGRAFTGLDLLNRTNNGNVFSHIIGEGAVAGTVWLGGFHNQVKVFQVGTEGGGGCVGGGGDGVAYSSPGCPSKYILNSGPNGERQPGTASIYFDFPESTGTVERTDNSLLFGNAVHGVSQLQLANITDPKLVNTPISCAGQNSTATSSFNPTDWCREIYLGHFWSQGQNSQAQIQRVFLPYSKSGADSSLFDMFAPYLHQNGTGVIGYLSQGFAFGRPTNSGNTAPLVDIRHMTYGDTADPDPNTIPPAYLFYRSDLNCLRFYNGSTFSCLGTVGGAPSSHSYTTDLHLSFALDLEGPVFQEVSTAGSSTFKSLIVKTVAIDPITCGTAPVLNLYDLGTSPTTAYGSATSVASVTVSTTSGGIVQSTASAAMTPGHYYSFGFSAGACSAQPDDFFVTANIQNN